MLTRTNQSSIGQGIDRHLAIGLLVLALTAGGCCSTPMRSEKARKEKAPAEQGDAFQAFDQDVKFWGFSNKARDIERQMGAMD